jgi:hypothetical protein
MLHGHNGGNEERFVTNFRGKDDSKALDEALRKGPLRHGWQIEEEHYQARLTQSEPLAHVELINCCAADGARRQRVAAVLTSALPALTGRQVDLKQGKNL